MFSCYILECADQSIYVGVAEDPAERERRHNDGKGSDWTATRRPVKLVWTEKHPTLSSARKRENQLKRWSRAKKVALGGAPFDSAQDKLIRKANEFATLPRMKPFASRNLP
jgi:predicted GIY-YIG superfamily endonuclease